jgi:hypothetical protein
MRVPVRAERYAPKWRGAAQAPLAPPPRRSSVAPHRAADSRANETQTDHYPELRSDEGEWRVQGERSDDPPFGCETLANTRARGATQARAFRLWKGSQALEPVVTGGDLVKQTEASSEKALVGHPRPFVGKVHGRQRLLASAVVFLATVATGLLPRATVGFHEVKERRRFGREAAC